MVEDAAMAVPTGALTKEVTAALSTVALVGLVSTAAFVWSISTLCKSKLGIRSYDDGLSHR